MVNKAKKIALMFLLWQMKTVTIYHFSTIKSAQIKNSSTTQGRQTWRKQALSYTEMRMQTNTIDLASALQPHLPPLFPLGTPVPLRLCQSFPRCLQKRCFFFWNDHTSPPSPSLQLILVHPLEFSWNNISSRKLSLTSQTPQNQSVYSVWYIPSVSGLVRALITSVIL